MKRILAVGTAAVLLGCSEQRNETPIAPIVAETTPIAPVVAETTSSLWVMVIDESGRCIPEAHISVVSGTRASNTFAQKWPCSVWEYDGGVILEDLPLAGAVTVRGAAPGFGPQDSTVVPQRGPMRVAGLLLSPVS